MGSSSEQVLRNKLPTFLAVPCRAALAKGGSPSERLRLRRVLLAISLRSYVAVLAPGATHALLHRLTERNSVGLGTWLEVAVALARARVDHPVLGPVARSLRDEKGKRQPAEAGLERLIRARNDEAHDRMGVSEAETERFLRDQREDLIAVLRGLESFRHLRVCALSRPDTSQKRGKEHALWSLRGCDPRELGSVGYSSSLDPGVPFLLGRGGETLPLAPLVALNWSGPPACLVFDHWHAGEPWYYGPDLHTEHSWHARTDTADIVAFFTEHWRPAGMIEEFARRVYRESERRPPELEGFSVGECIGRGASGSVWRATSQGVPCALKVLHPELVGDALQRERIRREATALYELSAEPGVCTVRRVVDDDERGPVLVMEYIEGDSLERRVEERRYAQSEAVELVRKLLRTLHVTHGKRLLHRDIKPSNVLLRGEEPVLIDFGLVGGDSFATLTQSTARLGTPQFAADELMNGSADADHRADLYSVGKVLGWCVTGSTDPDRHRGALTGRLHAVYDKATDRRPDARYADATEMLEALAHAVDDLDGPPVALGRVLADSYRLEEEIGPVEDGIWCFRATYLPGAPAAVLVARQDRGDRLAEVMKGRPEIVMARRSSCPWCAIHGDKAAEEAGRLFETKEPFDVAKWLPLAATVGLPLAAAVLAAAVGMKLPKGGKKSPSKRRARPSVPPYLEPFPLQLKTARAAATGLHRAGLVLAAQAHARGDLRLSDKGWFELQGKLFLPVSLAHSGALGQPVQELVSAEAPSWFKVLGGKARANEALSAADRKLVQAEYMRLLKAAMQLGGSTPAQKMAPFVRNSPLGWQLRTRRGTGEAYVLLKFKS